MTENRGELPLERPLGRATSDPTKKPSASSRRAHEKQRREPKRREPKGEKRRKRRIAPRPLNNNQSISRKGSGDLGPILRAGRAGRLHRLPLEPLSARLLGYGLGTSRLCNPSPCALQCLCKQPSTPSGGVLGPPPRQSLELSHPD